MSSLNLILSCPDLRDLHMTSLSSVPSRHEIYCKISPVSLLVVAHEFATRFWSDLSVSLMLVSTGELTSCQDCILVYASGGPSLNLLDNHVKLHSSCTSRPIALPMLIGSCSLDLQRTMGCGRLQTFCSCFAPLQATLPYKPDLG